MQNGAIAATTHTDRAVSQRLRWADKQAGHWFYPSMAAACLLISIAAFAPAIIHPNHRLGSSSWLVAVHGCLFFLWLIVFLAQALLITRGSYRTHRRFGTASAALAIAMVAVGYVTVIEMTRRGFDFSGDLDLAHDPLGPVNQMIFPLLDIVEFALLVAAGYALRRRSDYHKRLMLFATLALLPAPFAHFIGHVPLLKAHGTVVVVPIFLSLVASAIYDLAAFRRVHPVSLWIGLGMFILDNLSATVIGHSAIWTGVARKLVE
jgi:hypothetical protein